MSEPLPPEDPIWSRWRERHGPPNGSGRPEAAPEPPPVTPIDEPVGQPEPETISFGDPLDPAWAEGAGARSAPPPPPQPEPEPVQSAHGRHECLDWCPICRTADIVRATVPPELRSQFEEIQRDALVAFRAALDHYIDRLDGRDRPSERVEDIPIQ